MLKHTMIIPALLAMLALIAAGDLLAGEKVDRTEKASSKGLVVIENIVGSITVVGWDKDEIRVEGTLGDDVKELQFETGKKKSYVEVVYPRRARNLDDGAELVIHVPKGSEVEVECVSAWIEAEGLEGEVDLESVSGTVKFQGSCRELEIETISGAITVDGEAPEMQLASISGTIEAEGDEAEIEVESVSGAMVLVYDKLLGLSAESVSGGVKVDADLHPRGQYSVDVVNGTIIFKVPAKVSADFEVSTFNGNIDNEFGKKARKTSKYAPGKELEFTTGDGEAEVELNSFNGNVRILKR